MTKPIFNGWKGSFLAPSELISLGRKQTISQKSGCMHRPSFRRRICFRLFIFLVKTSRSKATGTAAARRSQESTLKFMWVFAPNNFNKSHFREHPCISSDSVGRDDTVKDFIITQGLNKMGDPRLKSNKYYISMYFINKEKPH